MRIVRLRIKGFRGIKEADIRLGTTSILIGPNNVGKTTLIEALALILGKDGMVRTLTEHDFYGSDPQPADRIKIIATIIDFRSQDPSHIPEWFSIKKGIPKWFNPTTGSESATPKEKPFELACEIAFQARFDHDSLEVETCRYFYDDQTVDDVFVEDVVTPVNIGLVRDIGLFLVPASRSWDRMISFGSELFRRVVSSSNGLPSSTILAQRDALRNPEFPLDKDPKLNPIVTEVNQEISSLFGPDSDLHLRITSTDSSGLLDAVIPHFGSKVKIPAKRQGSGLISMQSLFLLLHFGKRRVEEQKGFCLAIEEPELHLPPNIQRRVLRRLQALSNQIIVSTHSPLIAGFSNPTEILMVRTDDGVLTAKPILSQPLSAQTPNSIRTLFQLKRVETVTALMSEIVLVPEGTLDAEWLSLLTRLVELQADVEHVGISFSASVGIVPTQNAAVEETVSRLKEIHPRVVAIVDGDETGRTYASKLAASGTKCVLRWPNEWTIEDVIGWIIEPAEAKVLEYLKANLATCPADLPSLVAKLKSDDRNDPLHLKGDRVAYETIAQAISEQKPCMERLSLVLKGCVDAVSGTTTARFEAEDPKCPTMFIFRP